MIDFHSHLIPGVDDGAIDLQETRTALSAFQAQGVETIVTTPHLMGSLSERPEELEIYLERLDSGWAELIAMADAEFSSLHLHRGTEVMLDTPTPNLSDPRVRLGGTNFVLVEFPFMSAPPGIASVLFQLRLQEWYPVIAHPERYTNFTGIESMAEWRGMGGLLQVNGGSLLGRYGPQAQRLAWALLQRGWVDYVASDYHCRGALRVQESRAAIERAGGVQQARLLMEENPARLLRGEAPLPVPPLENRSSIWKRIFSRPG